MKDDQMKTKRERTGIAFRVVLLAAALALGAWFRFPWAAILLALYMALALIFRFESRTSLVAGAFILAMDYVLPHIHPDLAAMAAAESLRIYGVILVIFWLATIIDKRVSIAIVGTKENSKERKVIAVGGGGAVSYVKRGLRTALEGFATVTFSAAEGIKKAPRLSVKIWTVSKLAFSLFSAVAKGSAKLLGRSFRYMLRVSVAAGKVAAKGLASAVKAMAGFSWRSAKYAARSFIDFWPALLKFASVSSKQRNVILKVMALLVFFILVQEFANLAPLQVLAWMFFAAAFLFRWDGRIAIGIASILILFCPVVLSQAESQPLAGPVAEMAAVYSYYFLIMGVVLTARECWHERRSGKRRFISGLGRKLGLGRL